MLLPVPCMRQVLPSVVRPLTSQACRSCVCPPVTKEAVSFASLRFWRQRVQALLSPAVLFGGGFGCQGPIQLAQDKGGCWQSWALAARRVTE